MRESRPKGENMGQGRTAGFAEWRLACLSAIGLLLAAPAFGATGEINQVQLLDPPAYGGLPVTVRVDFVGQDKCKQISIDWGDSPTLEVVDDSTMTQTATGSWFVDRLHTYPNPSSDTKTYQVRVKKNGAASDCKAGTKQTSVVVHQSGQILSISTLPAPSAFWDAPVKVSVGVSNVCVELSVTCDDGNPPILVQHAPYEANCLYTKSKVPDPAKLSRTITVNGTKGCLGGPKTVALSLKDPGIIDSVLQVKPGGGLTSLPGYFGTALSFTITGQKPNLCKALKIDLGDGNLLSFPPAGGVPTQFPLSGQYTYSLPSPAPAAPQTRTVKVFNDSSDQSCQGTAQASVELRVPGQLSGMTASPSPATVGQEVTLKLQGAGQCGKVDIQFDTDAPISYEHVAMATFSTTHIFTTAKDDAVIKVTPKVACSGSATPLQLAVQMGWTPYIPQLDLGDILPKLIAIFPLHPKIEFAIQLSYELSGGKFALFGSQFGAIPGTARILREGKKGKFKLPASTAVTIEEWHDNYLVAKVPHLTKVVEQPMTIEITTSNGKVAKWLGGTFTPEEETRMLERSEVESLSCGSGSDCDVCAPGGCDDQDDQFCCFASCCTSLYAFHMQDLCWLDYSLSTGKDRYKIHLANQWHMTDLDWDPEKSGDDDDYCHDPDPGFVEGASDWSPSVSWGVSCDDYLSYSAQIYIAGPKGVPIK